jgi:hypothetical protein
MVQDLVLLLHQALPLGAVINRNEKDAGDEGIQRRKQNLDVPRLLRLHMVTYHIHTLHLQSNSTRAPPPYPHPPTTYRYPPYPYPPPPAGLTYASPPYPYPPPNVTHSRSGDNSGGAKNTSHMTTMLVRMEKRMSGRGDELKLVH